MKITVSINPAGGLAYENKLLGLNLHINGKLSDELELPLPEAQFRALKRAMSAQRLHAITNLDALQVKALKASGVDVPEAEIVKDDFQDRLNAFFEEPKAEEPAVEEIPEVSEIEAEAEAPAEEAPKKKGKKGKE